jgi:hypothetical protein
MKCDYKLYYTYIICVGVYLLRILKVKIFENIYTVSDVIFWERFTCSFEYCTVNHPH